MRVLMVSWGWRTHFFPLVPLGWALLAAGHQVRMAGQPSMVEPITRAGLPAVGVGTDLDFAEAFRGQLGRVGTRADRARADVAPVVTADGGIVGHADAMVDDLIAFGEAFRPDLVVHDPYNLAAALAAARLRVPAVRQLWGADSGTDVVVDERVVGPRAARLGVTADVSLTGVLTLDPCPPGMQVPLPGPSHPVRFVPYNGAAVVPPWLREPPARDRVCVTWGTVLPDLGMVDPVGVRAVVSALAELDVEVVVVVAESLHEGLRGLPPSVRLVAAPLALHVLLPTCRLLVHQGGSGAILTAMACGVPQLALPQVNDQHFNTERLTAAGGGLGLSAEEATPAAIRDAAAALLGDPAWAGRAEGLRLAVQRRPSPAQVLPVLTELAAAGVPA
ncbi:MAG TPA: nucleotide disphospho-sugar-binding domain-containing protein [Pseudonocardiaceae bacterium]